MLAVALRVALAFTTHFTQEDFLITLRYARNIAQGQGFVFNPGQRVLGTTTPLYALLLAAALRLGLPAAALGKAVNILADGALCVVVFRWLALVGQETAGRWAAFFIAVNPVQMRVAISGQESSLVALCGALVWYWYAQRRYRAAYLTAAVMFLLRWDSLLLTLVMTAALVLRERRLPWRDWAWAALLCLPWLLFATVYFGSPLPITLAAKASVYGWRFHNQLFPELSRLLFRLYGTTGYAFMALAAAVGLSRLYRERWGAYLAPVIWFGLYWLAFLFSKVWLFEWYLVPPLFVYVILAALGLTTVAARIPASAPVPVRAALAAGLAVALCVLNVRDTLAFTRSSQALEDHLRRPLGLWLRAHSRPTDQVMLEPIGYIGYYSRLPVLDVTGLVTPAVLPFYNSSDPCPLLAIADHFQPQWCILRPGERAEIQQAAQAGGQPWNYRFVRAFSYTASPSHATALFEVYRRE